jgi:hypothetical protein
MEVNMRGASFGLLAALVGVTYALQFTANSAQVVPLLSKALLLVCP